MRFNMEQKLEQLMAEILKMDPEEITDTLAMKDIDVWDSLKHMELIVAIEKTFDIELTFDEIVTMQNVKKIKNVLLLRGLS